MTKTGNAGRAGRTGSKAIRFAAVLLAAGYALMLACTTATSAVAITALMVPAVLCTGGGIAIWVVAVATDRQSG